MIEHARPRIACARPSCIPSITIRSCSAFIERCDFAGNRRRPSSFMQVLPFVCVHINFPHVNPIYEIDDIVRIVATKHETIQVAYTAAAAAAPANETLRARSSPAMI